MSVKLAAAAFRISIFAHEIYAYKYTHVFHFFHAHYEHYTRIYYGNIYIGTYVIWD